MQQPTDQTAQDVPPPAVSPPADSVTAADGQSAEGEREQEASQSANGTEQRVAASPVSAPSESGTSQVTAQDRYDYDRTSIILVAHLRPANQDGQPRQVWLSAQNGVGNEQDFPLYRLLSEADLGGPWPPAVTQLLEDLRQDLPARRQRYEARLAAKPTSASSSPAHHQATATTASTKHGKAPAKQAGTSAAATPVPTTSTPIPKQELGMAGLFEGLE